MLGIYKKALVVVSLVSAAGMSPVAADVIYLDEDMNIKRAEYAIKDGNLEAASGYYKKAIKSNLNSERLLTTLNNLCLVDYARADYVGAERACSTAISMDRRSWQAYVNRGNAKRALGNEAGAEADYRKAIKIKPNGHQAHTALAKLLEHTGKIFAEVK